MRLALVTLAILITACPPTDNTQDSGTNPSPTIESISPTSGPQAGGTLVTVNGANFVDGATVKFGTQPGLQVVVLSKQQLSVRTPVFTAAGKVTVIVTNPDTKSGSLASAFTVQATVGPTIDEAKLANPANTVDMTGSATVKVPVTASVQVANVTKGAGQGKNVLAKVGFSTAVAASPAYADFTWVDAMYTGDADGPTAGDQARDTYSAEVTLNGAGTNAITYTLAAAFSVDNGTTWKIADRDGLGNGLQKDQLATFKVSKPTVEWCKLGGEQIEAPPTINLIGTAAGPIVYGQVYRAGVTDMPAPSTGLTGQLGYGAPGSDPSTWTWVNATYSKKIGNNEEWQATLTNPGIGTYKYAFRFTVTGGSYSYCDANGLADGDFTEAQAGTLIVSAPTLGIEWCKLGPDGDLTPPSVHLTGNAAGPVVLGQVFKTGITTSPDAGVGLSGQLGYGAAGSDPSTWTWSNATYARKIGNNEEWQATLSNPGVGTYKFAYRFAQNSGAWAYCDADGLATDAFTEAKAGTLTVTAEVVGVEWCKLGGEATEAPPTVTLLGSAAGPTVYGQVYKSGITNVASPSMSIGGQLGYGAAGTNPSTWTWVAATYGRKSGSGSNEEWLATLPNPGIGTYKYAYRFNEDGGVYRYCDADGLAEMDFTEAQAGTLIVAPLTVGSCNLQHPPTLDSYEGRPTETVYGRVFVQGITDDAGVGVGLQVEVGYGPRDAMPADAGGWQWQAATFNIDVGAGTGDEYQAVLTGPMAGNYDYAYRTRVGSSGAWTYCDLDGSGNGYSPANTGKLTARPYGIDECKLDAASTFSVLPGATVGPVRATVRVPTLTDGVGAGAGIVAELGYGTVGTPPSTSWTWAAATFEGDAVAFDQYRASFTAPGAIGVTEIAYRFKLGPSGTYVYCDKDGFADGYSSAQGGRLTVTGKQITACKLELVSAFDLKSGDALTAGVSVASTGSEVAGATVGVLVQVGVGPKNDNASASNLWGWATAAYKNDTAMRDYHEVTVYPAYGTDRAVAGRASIDDGGTWTYCDYVGDAGFDPAAQYNVTVHPHTDVTFCNLQFPATASLAAGPVMVYGQIYDAVLTPDAGAPIRAEFGVGREFEDPGVAWSWRVAPFSGIPGSAPNNNEYAVTFNPDAGPSYAFRFSINDGGTWCYGDLDGNGSSVGGGAAGFSGLNNNLGTVVP